jgi:hypothetical protein
MSCGDGLTWPIFYFVLYYVTVNEWIYIGVGSVEGDEVVYIQEERGPSAVR